MGNEKRRWRISLQKPRGIGAAETVAVPDEFLCPISGLIMADPVIVLSGHTFERSIVNACRSLSFSPRLPGGAAVGDFSVVIPNLALKAAIANWCSRNLVDPPKPVDSRVAAEIVGKFIEKVPPIELPIRQTDVSDRNSEDSVVSPPPSRLPPSSSEAEITTSSEDFNNDDEEEELIADLKNPAINKREEALIKLREVTRTREETRAAVCTPRLLAALKDLIASEHEALQVNATAVLVNISLENMNKVKIVRSGFIQPLVEVLTGGFPESRDHAAGALFSLSIDNQNKAAIGVLGALSPLLHALRSNSLPCRHDSALALYHLSTAESNRVKLTKLGAPQILLGMVKSGEMLSPAMLLLRNLACSPEGRAAMLDGAAVECFLRLLEKTQSSTVRKSCLSAVYGMSYCGRRFKAAAKAAAAEEVMIKVLNTVNESQKEMVKRILDVIREEVEDEEEQVNWEELLDINEAEAASTAFKALSSSS